MAQTETDIASTELERVRKVVPKLFYWKDTFYQKIKNRPAEIVSNREARIPLQLQQGGDFGHFDPAGGSLGRGSGSKFKHALISIQHLKMAYEYQMLGKIAADNKRKAVVNNVKNLLGNAMREMRHYCDNMQLSNGNAVLAVVSTVGSSGLITCSGGNGIKLLREGQKVNVTATNGTTVRATTNADNYTQVTKFDPENNQVTLSPVPTGIAATDKIIPSGLVSATGTLSAVPTSVLGLKYHYSNASTGNWLKLSRATYPQLRAARVNAAGSLNLSHVRLARNKIGDRYGLPAKRNMKNVMIWAHAAQLQAYENLGQLLSFIPKAAKTEGLDLYFGDNMMLAGLKTMEHDSWDKSRLDIVDFGIWGRVEMKKPDFYEVEGRKMFEVRASDGGVAAATMFYLTAHYNTYIDNPMRAAYVDGLTVPTGY